MSDSGDTAMTTKDQNDEPEEDKDQPASDDSSSTGDDGDEGGTILDDGGVDTDARAGRSLGIDPKADPDEETVEKIEEEREKRLDPDNRPEGAEVDNTDRDFDVDRGQFTDADDYDESEPAPYVDPEDPNSSASADSDDESDDESGDESDDDSEGESDDEAEEDISGQSDEHHEQNDSDSDSNDNDKPSDSEGDSEKASDKTRKDDDG